MRLDNEKGIALTLTLYVVVVLLGFSTIFILRSVHENNLAKRDLNITKSFYIAEGGTAAGIDGLDNLINNFMLNTFNSWNPSVVVSQVSSFINQSDPDGIAFLVFSVQDGGTQVLTQNGNQAEYTQAAAFGSGQYQYDIIITEKTDPVTINADTWDFPYNYRVEANGSALGSSKDILLSGDFTVRVQRDNFAKYALFTNTQTLPSGTNVWFTNKTNFAGPIHTNGRYNIALSPSGTFEGIVEQHETLARFYNSGSPILLDADFNGTEDVPTFLSGFNRGVDAISLASPVQKQDLIDQATGNNTYSSNGIYVANNGTTLTGGIYVRGDSSISMTVDSSDNAVYQITQGGTQKNITVDQASGQTIVETVGVGTMTYQGLPDGVDDVGTIIFVDGNINSLGGTVQHETEVTISSESDIVLTNNVEYSNYTAAVGIPGTVGYTPPHADGEKNLLGLVSWEGDVRVGTSAPDNINVHGTILARSGILQVDSYNNTSVGPRGTATLLGGVISDNYGAFGLFSGSTGQQLSGYGRNFVYDERMLVGNAPPYFPSLNTFIAFTNDITDKMVWQEGG